MCGEEGLRDRVMFEGFRFFWKERRKTQKIVPSAIRIAGLCVVGTQSLSVYTSLNGNMIGEQ
jgi:hypothetical protein